MKCEYCEIAAGRGKAIILYEDTEIIIAIKDVVISPGTITVFPKEHYTILEMVPNDILERCANMANKVSVAAFEGMGCQGTNILVQNGTGGGQKIGHFSVEVIPRQEGDGLNLQWEPKQLMEDEMAIVFEQLKKEGDKLDIVGRVKKAAPKKGGENEEPEEEKENYMLKSLERIP